MVLKYTTELYQLKAQLCKTFSDPIRLMVIQELREGEKTVGTLQSVLGIPQLVFPGIWLFFVIKVW